MCGIKARLYAHCPWKLQVLFHSLLSVEISLSLWPREIPHADHTSWDIIYLSWVWFLTIILQPYITGVCRIHSNSSERSVNKT